MGGWLRLHFFRQLFFHEKKGSGGPKFCDLSKFIMNFQKIKKLGFFSQCFGWSRRCGHFHLPTQATFWRTPLLGLITSFWLLHLDVRSRLRLTSYILYNFKNRKSSLWNELDTQYWIAHLYFPDQKLWKGFRSQPLHYTLKKN